MMVRGVAVAPELMARQVAGRWRRRNGSTRAACRSTAAGRTRRKTTRQRYDYTPMEIAGNATLRPMRFVSVTGSYSFINIQTPSRLPFFTPEEMPGIDQELTYHVTRAAVAYRLAPCARLQHARRLLSRLDSSATRKPTVRRSRSGRRNTKWCSWCRCCASSSCSRRAR